MCDWKDFQNHIFEDDMWCKSWTMNIQQKWNDPQDPLLDVMHLKRQSYLYYSAAPTANAAVVSLAEHGEELLRILLKSIQR